jgi:hypothetical protein
MFMKWGGPNSLRPFAWTACAAVAGYLVLAGTSLDAGTEALFHNQSDEVLYLRPDAEWTMPGRVQAVLAIQAAPFASLARRPSGAVRPQEGELALLGDQVMAFDLSRKTSLDLPYAFGFSVRKEGEGEDLVGSLLYEVTQVNGKPHATLRENSPFPNALALMDLDVDELLSPGTVLFKGFHSYTFVPASPEEGEESHHPSMAVAVTKRGTIGFDTADENFFRVAMAAVRKDAGGTQPEGQVRVSGAAEGVDAQSLTAVSATGTPIQSQPDPGNPSPGERAQAPQAVEHQAAGCCVIL